MRAGEIISQKWDCIDYGKRTAYLSSTKNSDERYIPLSRRAIDLLKSMEGVHEEKVFDLCPVGRILSIWPRLGRHNGLDIS